KLVKVACFSRRNFLASSIWRATEVSSNESETTARPLPAYLRCISTRWGKFSLQGPHQVAQASTKVYLASVLAAIRDWYSANLTGSRRISWEASALGADAGVVAGSGAGFSELGLVVLGEVVGDGVVAAGLPAPLDGGGSAVGAVEGTTGAM